MSGFACVLVASASPSVYSVTVDDIGGSGVLFGYLQGSGGAISSSAFKSTTVTAANCASASSGNPGDIAVLLSGSLSQSYFSAAVVQRTDGTIRRYATADASFTTVGGSTSWSWDNNDPSWTAAGTRFLILYP